jgi:NAD(P)-dependent dehydrogenase (short-subunit alcohol dehydrogenase family)
MTAADQQKVALVTGAGSGIGRATAEAFIKRGYATALVDRDEKAGRDAEAQLRAFGKCVFIRCEVTDDASVRNAVDETVKTFGRLDAAFNAAGIDGEQGKATADCTMENWNRVIAVDLTGVWSCMRYEIPHMLKTGRGAIVNCASVGGIVGAPFVPAYVAAKHGVVGLTKAAALEYARQGIRVNAVCPGMIETPMTKQFYTPELAAGLLEQSPVGRFGQPAEIASAVLWLCDDSASFMTGQAIAVDGGWTTR